MIILELRLGRTGQPGLDGALLFMGRYCSAGPEPRVMVVSSLRLELPPVRADKALALLPYVTCHTPEPYRTTTHHIYDRCGVGTEKEWFDLNVDV